MQNKPKSNTEAIVKMRLKTLVQRNIPLFRQKRQAITTETVPLSAFQKQKIRGTIKR